MDFRPNEHGGKSLRPRATSSKPLHVPFRQSQNRSSPDASAAEMASHDHLFKLLLIGDSSVGKSSLLLRSTEVLTCRRPRFRSLSLYGPSGAAIGHLRRGEHPEHNRSGLQDQVPGPGWQAHQAHHLGYGGAGALSNFDQLVLQGRTRRHPRLRRFSAGHI
eukprot:scaffold149_cov315-Pinguiococcus_pyrenoidosus.AAC.80